MKTVWCTSRRVSRRSSIPARKLHWDEVVSAVLEGPRARQEGLRSRVPADHLRHAKHATLARDGGIGCGFSRAWGCRVRSGRRGRRVSSEEAHRGVSLHPTRELQHHHPCRRGVRQGKHLAGHPMVWRAPHRARHPTDRGHRARCSRSDEDREDGISRAIHSR